MNTMTHKEFLLNGIDYRKSAESSLDMQDLYKAVLMALGVSLVATLLILTVGAMANNSDIMHVIDSPILRGRNDLVDKYSTYVSAFAQAIITICGVGILTLKTLTISFSILYLANPTFWDSIAEKKEGRDAARENGDWMTTIVGYVVPNVKGLSDYGNSSEDDMYDAGGVQDVGTYFKDNIVQMVVLVTFASLMWSGKFLKLVGKISEGCVVIVDAAISIDYGGKVQNVLESERDYQFMYDTATVEGRNREKLAKAIYGQAKTAINDNNTSEFYNRVGGGTVTLVEAIYTALDGQEESKGRKHINMNNPTFTFNITWNSEVVEDVFEDNKLASGVYTVRLNTILGSGDANEMTVKEATVGAKGGIYISFDASQNYVRDQGNYEKPD